MVTSRKYVVVKPFAGEPAKDNFIIVDEVLPNLNDGEVLTEALFFSVDPYQKMKIGNKFPCDMIGGQIARIIESKNPNFIVGANVMGHFGWRTHTILNPDNPPKSQQAPYFYLLPDFGDLSLSLGIGVLGRVGVTAYCGFLELCQPKTGECVVITGAAGAVGSHVGQIAKILGCNVIGFAGTDEKCKWLTSELGFDFAFNYKTADVRKSLSEAAPDGVDCFFDNVGGELSSIVMSKMNSFGRIAVCGAISSYNSKEGIPRATIIQPFMVAKQLRMEGFLVNRFADKTQESIKKNLEWVKEGKLKYKEHIYYGFDSAVDALIGIFKGENTGKAIVKL